MKEYNQSGMVIMTGRHLRSLAKNLGRFASVRETAKQPVDRVLVQADGNVVKVVAGADFGTVVAIAHATGQSFRAVIAAREFLQAANGVSLKRTYQLVDLNLGWAIGCSLVDVETGDTIQDFLRLSKHTPDYMRPVGPEDFSQGSVFVPADRLNEIGKIFYAVTEGNAWCDDIEVAGMIHTKSDTLRLAAYDRNSNMITKWAATDLPGSSYEIFGLISSTFMNAVRGLGDSTITFFSDKVQISNETFVAVGKHRMLMHRVALDGPSAAQIDYRAVVERTKFVKIVRENGKLDNNTRIGVQYNDNGLNVMPFGKASHGWYMSAEKLVDFLAAIPAKQVGIGLRTGRGQPINMRIPEWLIELAPVELVPAE